MKTATLKNCKEKGGRGAKSRAGRPTKYKPEYADLAFKFCLLGATDGDLSVFFEVDEATINRWKAEYPEFCESLKRGKDQADANVAQSLYHRALGYSHPEDKIFNNNGMEMIVPTIKHYPPDSTAAIFWLKNRNSAKWRDKQEIDHTTLGEKITRIERVVIDAANPKD